MLITIDGPAGVGKSTLARLLSERLHIPFFETGALYRAITLKALEEKIDLTDEKAFAQLLENFQIDTQLQHGRRIFLLEGRDVTTQLRSEMVTTNVALVSTYLSVRKKVETIQQSMAELKDAIFEGRDMGSVVFPDADVKFFLTAKPEVRAKRRFDELQGTINFETVLEEVKKRDQIDSTRKHSPLVCPKGAHVIDTSQLDIQQVLNRMLNIYLQIYKKRTKPTLIYRLLRDLAFFCIKLFYRHQSIGIENLPLTGAIIAANHSSFLDPILVGCGLKKAIHFFARRSLFRNVLFGYLLKKINVHPIDRDAPISAVIKLAQQLVLAGHNIVIFPEGERSPNGEIQPFKDGAVFVAAKTNGVIVPTYVSGSFAAWPRKKKFPRFCGRTKTIFGKPIYLAHYEHLSKKQAIKECTKDLQTAVEQLKKQNY